MVSATLASSCDDRVVTIDEGMIEIASCGRCHMQYNRTQRAPVSIPCGHTLCLHCVHQMTYVKLFVCNVCQAPALHGWKFTKPNLDMIQLLEKLNLLANDDNDCKLDETLEDTVFPKAELLCIPPQEMHELFEHHFSILSFYLEKRLGKQTDCCTEILTLLEEHAETMRGYPDYSRYLEELDLPRLFETNSSPERLTNSSTNSRESVSEDETAEVLRAFFMENLYPGNLLAHFERIGLVEDNDYFCNLVFERNNPASPRSEEWRAVGYERRKNSVAGTSVNVDPVVTNCQPELERETIPPQTTTISFNESIEDSNFAESIIRQLDLDSD